MSYVFTIYEIYQLSWLKLNWFLTSFTLSKTTNGMRLLVVEPILTLYDSRETTLLTTHASFMVKNCEVRGTSE